MKIVTGKGIRKYLHILGIDWIIGDESKDYKFTVVKDSKIVLEGTIEKESKLRQFSPRTTFTEYEHRCIIRSRVLNHIYQTLVQKEIIKPLQL